MNLHQTSTERRWKRKDLERLDDASLAGLRAAFESKLEEFDADEAKELINSSVFKKRSARMLIGSLGTMSLTKRIERLFHAINTGNIDPWPVDEALEVMDGLISRILAKRLVLVLVALITVVPAVASLALLASQNQHMIEQIRTEERFELNQIRKNLLEVINGVSAQWIIENGTSKQVKLPTYHKRIREEAFGTYISIDKQRWLPEETQALKPTRFVDLRGCNLQGLALGGALGLIEGESRNDISRVYLSGANLASTKFLRSSLVGSVFKDSHAPGVLISSPDASYADFTGMQAPGALFAYDASTSTPIDLTNAIFDRADLSSAVFDQAVMAKVSFDSTNLSGVQVISGMVAECDLTQAELGSGLVLIDTPVHKTRVLSSQLPYISLPVFCYVESTEHPEVVQIMTDFEKYNAWWAQESVEMDAAVEQEAQEIEQRKQALEAAESIDETPTQ
jgi:uncharacterized protein YjbI with pentapeptide repeats